jgi:uncharacterized protein (TIGR00288 family)
MIERKKIALLIDYDNFNQEKYFPVLFEELNEIGDILIKYAYYSNLKDQSIENKFVKYGIEPKTQIAYSKGKNAVDIKMTIEAMELLSKPYIDSVCLASSDSDFTPLVFTLKSHNKFVIGAGDSKAKNTFIQEFDTFISVEKILRQEAEKNNDKPHDTELEELVKMVNRIIDNNHDEEGYADFSAVINTLKSEMKDFNPKNYGAKNKQSLSFFQRKLGRYYEFFTPNKKNYTIRRKLKK